MRWINLFLMFAALLLVSCFSGSTLYFKESDSRNEPNLVGNPGFERLDRQNPKLPAGWFVISSSPEMDDPVLVDSTYALTGKRSFKVYNADRNLYILSDAFKINYTGGYYIKGSIRSSRKMNKSARVYFWAYDTAGNKRNSFRRSVRSKGDWEKAEISAGFLKNQASFARIAIFIPKDLGNTIWLDDFGCYMVHRFTKE